MKASALPTRKIAWMALSGTIITLFVYMLNDFVPFFLARPISAELAATIITLVTTVVGYFVPPAATETVVTEDGVTKSART